MMGRQDEPAQLFYSFRLDAHVPSDHLLRGIDRVFDFERLRTLLAPYYSSAGRPSIDPELMIRMLLIGYAFGVRSERRLCEEVHLNLAYRWFCRLGLEGAVPDHSTFSKNRHGRFRQSDLFRQIFEDVVQACMAAGLVGGEGFAIDASVIEADASRNHRTGGKLNTGSTDVRATRPVRDYLDALDKAAVAETAKDPDGPGGKPPDEPNADPKYTSLTDPAAAWTNKGQSKALFAYGTNYLIDTQSAVIVDVEATPARWRAEVAAMPRMLLRTQARFGLTPQTLAADAAYGSGLMLGWLMEQRIVPHIPILDRERQTANAFTRAHFTFDATENVYICPAGKRLANLGLVRPDGSMSYRAAGKDCRVCALKPQCTPAAQRTVTRNVHEDARQHVRDMAETDAFKTSARLRKKVEMCFAHLKRNLNFRRLRLRGLSGARDEFHLAATVQNLRKLVRYLTCGPPSPGLSAAPA